MKKQIKIVGLTGEMGTGKSTVAKFLEKHKSVKIFDCDNIAKKLLLKKTNIEKVEEFLEEKIIKNGKVDKKKIASIIFQDEAKKQKMENFIHPLVWENINEQIIKNKEKKIFIVESAIIYKIGWDKYFDKIILVTSTKEKQIKRIKNKSRLSDEQIKERLDQQMLDKKIKKENLIVIDNNGSFEELKRKTNLIFEKISPLI